MSLGLDPDAFWRATPRYIAMIIDAKASQFRREHNERAWLAYHVALLGRMKRLPDMRKLMAREPSIRRLQSADQQWAIMSAMAEAAKVARKN